MSMTCGKSPRQVLGRTPDVNLPVSITPAKQKFPEPRQGASTYTGGIIGGIICVIILIAIIATTIVMVRKCQRKNIDRPPTHKPPPPTKTYSYSDRPSISKPESDPELMHHDTEKEEPMTDNLVYYDDKDHHEPSLEDNKTPYHDDRDEDEDGMMGEEDIYYITSSATRGSSFMSPAVIV